MQSAGRAPWTSEALGNNSDMQMQNIYHDFSRIVEGTANHTGAAVPEYLPQATVLEPLPQAAAFEALPQAWEPSPLQQPADRWVPLPEEPINQGPAFFKPKQVSLGSVADRNLIWLFTFSLLAVFVAPSLQMLRVASDRSVEYFLGSWINIVGVIPLTCLAGHISHVMLGRPDKHVVILCLLVPTVVLLVVADVLIWKVSTKADELFSTDCDTFFAKRDLDRARDAAERIYQTCLVDTLASEPAIKSNLTLAQAMQLYRITDCEEYEFELRRHELQWQYLSWLEDKYQCAGWCEFTAPLWTRKEVQDSCSVAVSSVFSAKIMYMSSQVATYTVVTMTIVCGVLLAVRKRMQQAEQDNMRDEARI